MIMLVEVPALSSDIEAGLALSLTAGFAVTVTQPHRCESEHEWLSDILLQERDGPSICPRWSAHPPSVRIGPPPAKITVANISV